ncbi:MAG: hypothetical protein ACI9YT_001189 [Halobacteriales archaeon]|jgi:hypothetical protein
MAGSLDPHDGRARTAVLVPDQHPPASRGLVVGRNSAFDRGRFPVLAFRAVRLGCVHRFETDVREVLEDRVDGLADEQRIGTLRAILARESLHDAVDGVVPVRLAHSVPDGPPVRNRAPRVVVSGGHLEFEGQRVVGRLRDGRPDRRPVGGGLPRIVGVGGRLDRGQQFAVVDPVPGPERPAKVGKLGFVEENESPAVASVGKQNERLADPDQEVGFDGVDECRDVRVAEQPSG